MSQCCLSRGPTPLGLRQSCRSSPEHLLAEKVKPDLPFSLFPDPELNRQSLVYRIKVGEAPGARRPGLES
jgi:hypothetical protein